MFFKFENKKIFFIRKYLYVFFLILIFFSFNVLFAGKRKNLIVEFLDVGNSDAVLIITPSKQVILIDGGNESQYKIIKKYLNKYNVNRIDNVILSNPKNEHIGGLIKVINNYDVGDIYDSGMPFTSYEYEHFLETIMKLQDTKSMDNIDANIKDILIKKHHYEYYTKKAGDVLNWGPDVEAIVLNPPRLYSNTSSDVNNNSLVIKLIYGRIKFLFASDINIEAVRYLLSQGYKLRADIIKVPNHGAKNSNPELFVKTVKPETAVISAGDISFPDTDTLDNYKTVGAKIYRTDLNGTIRIVTDGIKYTVYPEKSGKSRKIILASHKKVQSEKKYNSNIRKININNATVEQLLESTGIGVFKAQMIIKYRNKHGKYKSITDLKKVPGITSRTINKLQNKITF